VTALDTRSDVRYSDLSLELDVGAGLERYVEVAALVGRLHRASRWWIGDLVVAAEQRFGERAAQVADALGLAPDTVMNYAWAAERIPPARRRAALSFSTHREVAALPADAQDEMLDRAERDGLSSADVRAELRALRGPEVAEVVRVRVPCSVAAAARRRACGRSLGEVAAELLTAWAMEAQP